ncbi:MAG: hypothetical protein NTY61_00710, partial [Candidatus Parcubacteria bacterium]|nr:hypothetical protein [Candidatus Parcubacteria bacterium]
FIFIFMNQESRLNYEGPIPPGVAKKLHDQLAGKEVFSAEHLIDKCVNPLTGQSLKPEDLKPGRVVFLMNSFGLVGAVYRLVGLHPVEPASNQMWLAEQLSISRAHNLDKIKKIRRAIVDGAFEGLQEGEEDSLARFEAGERISCPARWQEEGGVVARAFGEKRLAPDERDQMMDLFFEPGE